MLRHALRIARIRGIDVRLDPSLVLLALLFAWVFANRFGAAYPPAVAWAMAGAGVVGVLLSILAHELAHALEAQHRGIEVDGITLLMFGGVTEMHAHSESPRDEFVIAAVGPYASLVCGAVFGLIATFAPELPGGLWPTVAEVAGVLAWLNVVLAVFNLVPGAPLDGGRVLRAAIWWVTRSRRTGLRVAAHAGQALAVSLVALGVWGYLTDRTTAARGGLTSLALGLFLGFFLWSAARAELRQNDLDGLLDGRTVADLIAPLPAPVAADQPLDVGGVGGQAGDTGEAGGADLLPVVEDGRLVGVLVIDELRSLHTTDRGLRTAGELMRPVDGHPTVELDADVRALLAGFDGDNDLVRVAHGGRPIAAVTEREVARALQALRASGRSGRRATHDLSTTHHGGTP